MDKTTLDLISIVLGGIGLFVVLTKFSVPELNAMFVGSNPFAVKRDIIDRTMTRLFTALTLLGLLVQVGAANWGNHIEQRVHTPRFYLLVFVVVLAAGMVLAFLLTAAGKRLARRSWLPRIVESQKGLYKAASFVIEHDGCREDQLTVKGTLHNPELDRTANLERATEHIEQIEKLLFEVPSRSTELRTRLDGIKPFFERR
jgi:hypothetical protein